MSHLVAKMLFGRKDVCKPMSPKYLKYTTVSIQNNILVSQSIHFDRQTHL